jgi:hypothetical protein
MKKKTTGVITKTGDIYMIEAEDIPDTVDSSMKLMNIDGKIVKCIHDYDESRVLFIIYMKEGIERIGFIFED